MQETPSLEYVEAERSELESVAASLVRTPRLEQLLRYLARRYFEGETGQLTEYNIATEVFGRKKTEFIASQDAIARVETLRLRKKLTAFYENEGRDHAIQISIPLGTYIPNFAERSGAPPKTSGVPNVPLAAVPAAVAAPVFANPKPYPEIHEAGPISADPARPGIPSSSWLYALAALVVVAALAGWAFTRSHSSSSAPGSKTVAAGIEAVSSPRRQANGKPALPPVAIPFRMIAGYDGVPQRDNTGDVWQPDIYYRGGWSHQPSQAFIARAGNPLIFRYGRNGECDYNIPLAPGVYELHLYFMQASDTAQAEDAENKEVSNVDLNGTPSLKNFDIVADAMGRNTGDERVFRDVSPAADGMLHIHLSTVLGTPTLNAIQILAGTEHRQLPIRIVMQPNSYTDHAGQLWRPDDYYLSGRSLSHNIPGTSSDPDMVPFERYGHFQYAIPVDPRDRYTLVLHFVELHFGTTESNVSDNKRIFRVLCNGQTLLDDFEILKEAGTYHVLKKEFYHLKPSAQGKLNLDFEPVLNYATVSAIEVLDESK